MSVLEEGLGVSLDDLLLTDTSSEESEEKSEEMLDLDSLTLSDGEDSDENNDEPNDEDDDWEEVNDTEDLDDTANDLFSSSEETSTTQDDFASTLMVEDIDNLLKGVKFERTYSEVEVEDLVVSEMSKNIRQQTVKGLTASVSDMERILTPIDVLRMPKIEGVPDQYLVISGLRRMYGAIRNNMKRVPVFIWDFPDFEKASKLSFLLGLVINKQQAHNMQEIWSAMQVLERDYNLKPAQVERLFPNMSGGDAMKLKDVALGEYDEPRETLFSGEKTLEQCYKLLQKLRKEADDLEMEDNKGILSETELGQETIVEDDGKKDNLSPEEVRGILEMDDEIDLEDSDIFGESADAGHHQDRTGGDGDDDLSTEAKNRIKMRDQMLCRACTRLEEKDEQGRPYVLLDPDKVNDAAGFNAVLTVHHIIPVHAGGTDDDDNLVTLCLLCHHRLHVMEKMGKIMVDENTFKKMSKEMQHDVKAAYYYARKAIKAGQLKGYNRKQRQELAQKSLRHKFPGMEIKNDTALLGSMN